MVEIELPGSKAVRPMEINNRRIVSGTYQDAAAKHRSSIWMNGEVLTIDYPGAEHTLVAAITNAGFLFGNWGTGTDQHAGYYDHIRARWIHLPEIPGYRLNFGQ